MKEIYKAKHKKHWIQLIFTVFSAPTQNPILCEVKILNLNWELRLQYYRSWLPSAWSWYIALAIHVFIFGCRASWAYYFYYQKSHSMQEIEKFARLEGQKVTLKSNNHNVSVYEFIDEIMSFHLVCLDLMEMA